MAWQHPHLPWQPRSRNAQSTPPNDSLRSEPDGRDNTLAPGGWVDRADATVAADSETFDVLLDLGTHGT